MITDKYNTLLKRLMAMSGFILLISVGACSQNGASKFTVFDVAAGATTYLQPSVLEQITWQSDTSFLYVKNDSLFSHSVKGIKHLVLTLKELKPNSSKTSSFGYFPDFKYYDNCIYYLYDKTFYKCKLDKKTISTVHIFNDFPQNIEYSKTVLPMAYTLSNNLYIVDNNGKNIAVTRQTNPDIINGQAVSRNEFGIENGCFWSPKGNYLAYYSKDDSAVMNYPLTSLKGDSTIIINVKYPMAGTNNEKVSLIIYNLKNKKATGLNITDFNDFYITSVTWGPDEKYMYAGILNREQDHLKFNKYVVTSGNYVKTLFEEKNEKYVEPIGPAYFINNSPSQFLWLSRRDGYNHIYLYDSSGTLVKQVNNGEWEVTKLFGTNQSGNYVFYGSTMKSPLERHIYLTDIAENQNIRLSRYGGLHEAYFSPAGNYFVDQFNENNTPARTFLMNSTGKMIDEIYASSNPLENYKLGEREVSVIKAADGKTDLYYRLIKPVDFDPAKKYPVILYVYGGPHVQLIDDGWPDRTEIWLQYMAQKGYVCFTLDSRGSEARGLDFESVIYKNLGVNEMADQIKGIEFLKQLSWVDTNRIGVHGWSFGGFMTISLMLHYPDIFKVGVAGGAVTDWKMYEIMYGERYMDTPKENPGGFELTSLNNKAANLKGKLLIIHGGMDTVVVEQNSRVFVNECIHNNIPVDYFIYHEHAHHVTGTDRVHLIEKIALYFDGNL